MPEGGRENPGGSANLKGTLKRLRLGPVLTGPLLLEGQMLRKLSAFLADESGATSIEYIVVASLIALVIVGAVVRLGSSVHTMFTAVTTAVK